MPAFRIALLAVLAALSCVTPAAAQSSSARQGMQLPSEQMLNRFGLTRSWWSHATINSKRDKLLYMVVDETHLFLQSSSGTITAFDTETGRYLWTRMIGAADRGMFPATSNDELLFVVNGLRLFAVRKDTGDVKWQLQMPGMPASSPVADAKLVYVGFVDGSLYAFDLKITQELFTAGKLPQYSESTVLWRYRTSKSITIPAVPGENVVAFASRNGSLYSVTKEHRKLVFQFETDAPLSAPVVRYKDSLLLASEDFNFYSLDIRNGRPGWQFTAGVVIRRAPILIDDEVYLFPDQGNMYKLSAATGHPYWSMPRMQDFLAASSTRVYVADRHNNLMILSRENGEPLGTFPLDKFTHHLANDRSDRIYVATASGLVMCLHERGREFARFHMHPDRQPILPDFAPDDGTDAAAAPGEEPAAMEDGEAMPAKKGEQPEGEPEGEMSEEDADTPKAKKAESEDDEEMEKTDKPEKEMSEEESESADGEKPDEDAAPDEDAPKKEKTDADAPKNVRDD
jgi:outer membrane protein assembly factor BamB